MNKDINFLDVLKQGQDKMQEMMMKKVHNPEGLSDLIN